MKKYIYLLFVLFLWVGQVMATVDSTLVRDYNDSIRVSLVTCSPGTEVYAVYGHTALRYEVPSQGIDYVFNYGLFDFDAPNFIWNFIKGDTDYLVGVASYPIFERGYIGRGSSVTLQELNLTQEEKMAFAHAMASNLQPENRVYRYNFLYTNCSTKARDKVMECLQEELHFPVDSVSSYRSIIHQYTAAYPWLQFGIDYLLGIEADRPIAPMEQMFAPEYLEHYIDGAFVTDSSVRYPLVLDTEVVEPIASLPEVFSMLLSPVQMMILLLLLTAVVCTLEYYWGRRLWWYDSLLFIVQGLMGCIVAFLFFFSGHPTVGSNIQVIYLNPLPLLFIPFIVWTELKHRKSPLYYVLGALTAVFILVSLFVGQYIHPAAYLFALVLLLRIVHNVFFFPILSRRLNSQLDRRTSSSRSRVVRVALLLLSFPATLGAVEHQVPKVVVSIMVDQLRADYIEKYTHLYSDGGFKKLWSEGHVFTNGYFNHNSPDRSSAVASIYTGTDPYYHGITANRFLERKSLKVLDCVDDSRYEGVGTEMAASPHRLLVTTITDELKMATRGHAYVISIAPERDVAILSGGHAPNAALWLSDDQCLWSTSTYYGGLPGWTTAYNRRSGTSFDFKHLEWEPYYSTGVYSYSVYDGIPKAFRHTFQDDKAVFRYKTSACINDEITSLAKTVIAGHLFGRNQTTDMLCVGFYAGNYEHSPEWERPLEIQDIYCRLDRNIAELIEAVDEKVGVGNALFVITSTGYTDASSPDSKLFEMPTGEVNISRIQSLLGMYLSAMYGKDDYIEGVYMNHIYLNRELIERRQLKLTELLECCREFLSQADGVKRVYPSLELLSGSADKAARAAYHAQRSGDLTLEIAPGYTLVDERWSERRYVQRSHIPVPIFFYGSGVKAEVDRSPVSVDVIAPTVASLLRINVPNGCSTRPIEGL